MNISEPAPWRETFAERFLIDGVELSLSPPDHGGARRDADSATLTIQSDSDPT